jgi:hypothetical protein
MMVKVLDSHDVTLSIIDQSVERFVSAIPFSFRVAKNDTADFSIFVPFQGFHGTSRRNIRDGRNGPGMFLVRFPDLFHHVLAAVFLSIF